jgi:hypothetical protein
VQPAVDSALRSEERRALDTRHAGEIVREAERLLADGPMTALELGRALAQRFDGAAPSDLAMTARVRLPLVQVPPRGLWGGSGSARHAPLEAWLGRPLDPSLTLDDLVWRYLGAFGPATPADARAWSGLPGLAEVFERLRPRLTTFRDEQGRELFDLPDAPRPAAEVTAPPRLLYDFDNLLLSYEDRSRFAADEAGVSALSALQRYSYGSLLVDGVFAGRWRFGREPMRAVVTIDVERDLTPEEEDGVNREGRSLLAMWAPDAVDHEVRLRRGEPNGPNRTA